MPLRVIPTPASFLAACATGLDDLGQPVHRLRSTEGGEEIVDAELIAAADANDVAERFLARPDVAFVHARFPVYGCFACRVQRG